MKPTTTLVIILKWSFKKSAFTYYFSRCFTHCSNAFFCRAECDRIFNLGRKHGYTTKFMQDLYLREKAKCNRQTLPSGQRETSTSNEHAVDTTCRLPIPYRFHTSKRVRTSLKSVNVARTFKRAPTIFNILRNDEQKIE